MKRISLAFAAALLSTQAFAQTQFPASTLWGNVTASTGLPSTVLLPNCPTGVLNFTPGTGFGCGAGGGGGGISTITSTGNTLTVTGTTTVNADINLAGGNTWTQIQAITTSQNLTVGWTVTNPNAGATASAGYIMSNGTNAASLAIAGTGYSAIPILVGKTFLYSGSTPLALDTGANQPVIFGINNTEIARLTGTGLGIQPGGQGMAPDAPLAINLNTAALDICPSGCDLIHMQGANSISAQIGIFTYGLEPGGHNATPHFLFHAARGTPASKTAVGAVVDLTPTWQNGSTLGDYLGFIGGAGYDGSAYYFGAAIAMRPAELYTSTAHGTGIMFGVTPIGGSASNATYPFFMHPNGYFVINRNTTAPPTPIIANSLSLQMISKDGLFNVMEMYAYGAGTDLFTRTAGNTQAAPAALGANSGMFGIATSAHNGTTFVANAAINFDTDTLQAVGNASSYIAFSTTPKSSATIQENMRLWGAGGLSVGTANVSTEPAAGTVMATGFRAGANVGVTCAAGISATTGRSVNGIITAC